MALSKSDEKKKGAVKKLKAQAEKKQENKKSSFKEVIKKKLPARREAQKVSRIEGVRKFFRGVLNELKKVHWPNRREILIYTGVVLVSVVFVAVLIWIFDSGLSQLLNFIL